MRKTIISSLIANMVVGGVACAAEHTSMINIVDKDYSETDAVISVVSSSDGYSVVNGNLTLGSSETQNITVTAMGTSKMTAGIFMKNADPKENINAGADDNFVGVRNRIEADVIKITVNSEDDGGLWIQGQRNFENYTEEHPLRDEARAKVFVKAGVLDISARDHAIKALSWSQVDIEADTVRLNAENIIGIRGGSIVNINAKTTQLDGNILFSYDKATSGTGVDATVRINLDGANSYWKGNSVIDWDTKPSDDLLEVTKAPEISLSNGAVWEPTNVGNSVSKEAQLLTEGTSSQAHEIDTLSLNDGVINIKTGVTTGVKNINGSGIVNLAVDGDKTGTFTVQTATAASLDVNLMDAKMERELSSDDINAEQAKALLTNVGSNKNGETIVETKTEVKEGLVNPGFGVNSKGETATNSANTLMQSSLELASAAPLALNRIMMNDVRKRLGDIRTSNGTHGAWARYDGGKLSGEGGLENDFHTIQVGIDTVPTADAPRMGVAFSYTDSDAEYVRGSADMKAYSLAMYSTWMGDNGQFFDLIGRMGTADTDMVVDGQHKGSMDNVALSMSGEFGWRFDVTNSIYVEPQVEATYTYVNEDSLSLSTANYDVDAVHSLLGRIGFAAGMKCPSDYGNVYVRASAVHEFLGDSKITGVNAGNTNVYEIDGKDTWFEYGIGANFNITKSTYMWADVERTTGGALDEDWRATVGVRYAW